jgi:Anaphase promoting complex (APC) subunit 2
MRYDGDKFFIRQKMRVILGVTRDTKGNCTKYILRPRTRRSNISKSMYPLPLTLTIAVTASAIVAAPSNVQSTAEQAESEMQIYWYARYYGVDNRTFIVGMLTNLGVLPVERIQSMLSMFVPAPNAYNRTEGELRDFLAEEVRRGKLEFVKGESGGYKLVQG